MELELDVLGQQPDLLQIYTQISLFFYVPDASFHEGIISTLTKGLKRLSNSFPWIAGQVDRKGYQITPLDKSPTLIIKDLRDKMTIQLLRDAEFPMRMLEEDLIAPRRTLAGESSEPNAVFLVQVNWIGGGLILTFNGQHGAMDMVGQGQVIGLLSKACRNESFTEEELATNNLKRPKVVPLLDQDYKPRQDAGTYNHPIAAASNALWAYFSFDARSLHDLKVEAEKTKDESTPFISTDDAVSAFIWKSTTKARIPRLHASDNTKFCRAVDVRSAVGVPKNYPGLLQIMTYHSATVQCIVDAPLGVIAADLRSKLASDELRRRTQEFATSIAKTIDKTSISLTPGLNPGTDVQLSSWAKVNYWDMDFGLGLGKPESVRRPRFTPFEGLMYLMPKAPNGEISMAISLRKEDMEMLRADEEFSRYAKFIG